MYALAVAKTSRAEEPERRKHTRQLLQEKAKAEGARGCGQHCCAIAEGSDRAGQSHMIQPRMLCDSRPGPLGIAKLVVRRLAYLGLQLTVP